MENDKKSYRLGLALVTIAALAWSTTGWFTRALDQDTATILFWRSLFGAGGTWVLLAAVPALGGPASVFRLGRAGFAYAALTAVSMFFFIGALHHTSVAHVAIITALVPFVAAFAGWLFLSERPGGIALTASVVALIGVTIMAGLSTNGGAFGNVLAVIMTFCMAGMILVARRYPAIPPLAATMVAALICSAATLPFAKLNGFSSGEWFGFAAFGIINQVIGFGFFALGARLLPPTETALITSLEGPLAPFWVWMAFGETQNKATLLGGALVIAAVFGNILLSAKVANKKGGTLAPPP
jgi:drug/metabolite transporter (DMT)-like permease